MENEAAWDQAVEKLIRLTQEGQLQWEPFERTTPFGDEEEIQGTAYAANVQGRRIAVYEYRYRQYTPRGEPAWVRDVAVELIDGEGQLEYRWPKVGPRWALLESVRSSGARADGFLETFLADKG